MTDQRSLRVLIGSLGVGGAERHLLQVLPEMARLGWKIRVLTLGPKGDLSSDMERSSISVQSLSGGARTSRFPRLLRRIYALMRVASSLYREFRRDRTSLAWFVLPEAYIIGGLAACAARFRGPMIMSRRSLNDYQKGSPGSSRLERWLHRRMFLILGNSGAVARQLEIEEGVPRSRLRLVYNGVDFRSFESTKESAITRTELGISLDAFVMIMVANLIPYKGHGDLIDALTLAKERLPVGWCLLCVGSGDQLKHQLIGRARRAGIGSQIIWLGQRGDVVDLLKASDLGLLTSHQEGFSNALLEGMAAGLPMVATDVGGNGEAMVDGETGYLVPAHAPDALSSAILELADDEEKRRRFGARARSRVLESFALETCVEQYDRIFSDVANGLMPPASKNLTLESSELVKLQAGGNRTG